MIKRRELFHSRRITRGRVDLPPDPDPNFFFENLDAYRDAASSIKHHTLPITLFTGPDLGRFDRVFRTHEMPQLAEELSTIARQEVRPSHANRSGQNLSFDDLSGSAKDTLRARVEPDYAHLRNLYDNPFC